MFREDVYTRTLKYRRWNNKLRPFHLLKKRVANIFRRRGSSSNDSWGTSTQTIVNQTEWEEDTESCDSNVNSVHSDWSELLHTERNVQCSTGPSTSTADVTTNQVHKTPIKQTMKNIVLVPYKPKPKEWGSWHIKSPYATSTVASQDECGEQEQSVDKITYVPHSPYYLPAHSPQFYEDE